MGEAEMTSHELARKLLEGPDLRVTFLIPDRDYGAYQEDINEIRVEPPDGDYRTPIAISAQVVELS